MNRIKRSISFIMAVIMLALLLPIAEIKAYAEGTVKITGIKFERIYNKDKKLDEKNSIVNILIEGDNLQTTNGKLNVNIILVGESKETKITDVSRYLELDEKFIKLKNIPGENINNEIKLDGKAISFFDEIPKIMSIDPKEGIKKDIIIKGNNLDNVNDGLDIYFIKYKEGQIEDKYRIKEEDIINGDIVVDFFQYKTGKWDIEFSQPKTLGKIKINSYIKYEDLIKVDREAKDLGMKIDKIEPNMLGIDGGQVKVNGNNILNIDGKYLTLGDGNVEVENGKVILTDKAGKFKGRIYKKLIREIEFFMDKASLKVEGKPEREEFIVEIPKCEDGNRPKRDMSVKIITKIEYEDDEEEFYEEYIKDDGFEYEIKDDNRLILEEVTPKIIIIGKTEERVLIKLKNILLKENIKIFIDDNKLESDKYSFESVDGNTEIDLQLPIFDKPTTKKITIRNNINIEESFEIKYVKELEDINSIKDIYIAKKPKYEIGDFENNNKFLIESFKLTESQIYSENLELILKSEEYINEEFLDEQIHKLRIVRTIDGKDIIISKGKIIEEPKKEEVEKGFENKTFQLNDNGEVRIFLDEEALKKLSYGVDFEDNIGGETAAGKYQIYLNDSNVPLHIKHINNKEVEYKYLDIKDKPWVKRTIPSDGAIDYNPNEMYKTFGNDSGYYLQAIYDNLDGLSLINKDGSFDKESAGISVKNINSGEEFIDTNKKLQLKESTSFKESTLYIPLKEKLKDGEIYEIKIPSNNYLEYEGFNPGVNNGFRNKGYIWRFGTKAIPIADQIFEGSVVENYDTNYPIILEGLEFTDETMVKFKNSKGDVYPADEVRYRELEDGSKRLYVYLPRGRDKLRVGNYKIIIKNGSDHESEMEYGVFSVIKEGREIPNEEYTIKDDRFYGDIKSMKKKSEGVLELRSSDRNRNYLRIDLDDLMGADTWSRSLEYPVGYGESIGNLLLESKWADISIANVRLGYDYNERYIKLRAGRAAPGIISSMKAKLFDKIVKSDFIEVQGENFIFDIVTVEIPYKNSEGENLQLMKYDEMSRTFITVPSIINTIDGTIKGSSMSSGIFVVVE